MLSIHSGYDVRYLTEAATAGSRYYTGAAGEPPGEWGGRGAAALGLAGQVDPQVMQRLYHEGTAPDGTAMSARKAASYKTLEERADAAVAKEVARHKGFLLPEQIREIRLRERAKMRNSVPFYDYTFSVPKSVSVLWASLRADAALAEEEGRGADAGALAERARAIEAAVRRANDRLLAAAEQHAAYVRTGHHSASTGEWRDADGFVVASFLQHTTRAGDPQLHIHNAILNRAQRADGADGKWRALHGKMLWAWRLGLSAYADRFLAQELDLLGYRMVQRGDGEAFEVGGITDEAMAAFSDRSVETAARARELAAQYETDHGRAPDQRAMYKIRQRAALETRDPKDHDPPPAGQELAAWTAKSQRREAGKLAPMHRGADRFAAEHDESALPSAAERARAVRIAVAEVQRQHATWSRSNLLRELHRALPSLPTSVDPKAYLDELADHATSGRADGVNVLRIAPAPDVVDVSGLDERKDGTSIYRPPDEDRFCTAEHMDREKWLTDTARTPVREQVTKEQAEEALAGTGLEYDQRQACIGLLASKELVTCLLAPAGTGKTYVMARFAEVWQQLTPGRVIGLTTSENAARQLKAEGLSQAWNIAKFFAHDVPGQLLRGDVLVVDEASQVSTEDLARIWLVAITYGLRIILTGDPGQLSSVEAGGMFRFLARRLGHWKLTEVRRFTEAWQREASLRVREGDITALGEYDRHGRINHGPAERMDEDAVSKWWTWFGKKDVLLLAATNEHAAQLARMARERLVEHREIPGQELFRLRDGNPAGLGDHIRARLNTKIEVDGVPVTNRDVLRITGVKGTGDRRTVTVQRRTGPGQWSDEGSVPVAYIEKNAELAYAGNVYTAQGRTVDMSVTVVTEAMDRELLYVALTRGRGDNSLFVVTGPADPEEMTRQERDAHSRAVMMRAIELANSGDEAAAHEALQDIVPPESRSDRQLAPWEAVLAGVLAKEDPDLTALEAMKAAQDFVVNTGHVMQIAQALWWKDVVPRIDQMVRVRITAAEYQRYLADPERPAFLDLLREHEIGGRPIPDLLDAITATPLTGARSVAAVLHGRAGKEQAPQRGNTTSWTERTPRSATQAIRDAFTVAAARQAELGRQVAEDAPQWAVQAWGPPPAEPGALRRDWEDRSAIVQSYRELAGITDPAQAIGPPPSGQADMREAFRAAVRALELADDAAMLKAMGRGDLEAKERAYERAKAAAPPDVSARLQQSEKIIDDAVKQAENARRDGNPEIARSADKLAQTETSYQADLRIGDARRREWTEANKDLAHQAEQTEAELNRRDAAEAAAGTSTEPESATDKTQVERRQAAHKALADEVRASTREPGHEAEPGADAQERPAAGLDELTRAQVEAAHAEWLRTQAEAEHGGPAPLTPDEIEQFGSETEAEAAQKMADLEDHVAAATEQLQAEQRDAARTAARRDAMINEPVIHDEPEITAEAEAETSWQPGETVAPDGPATPAAPAPEAEPEIEL